MKPCWRMLATTDRTAEPTFPVARIRMLPVSRYFEASTSYR